MKFRPRFWKLVIIFLAFVAAGIIGVAYWVWSGLNAVATLEPGMIELRLPSGQPEDGSTMGPSRRHAMIFDSHSISNRSRFRAALLLAIIADALQIAVFPLFVEGAESPAADILDLGVGAVLAYLLGWHWEFLPSFLGKLVPGVDLVPFWTMAVANVYRKSKRIAVTIEGREKAHSAGNG